MNISKFQDFLYRIGYGNCKVDTNIQVGSIKRFDDPNCKKGNLNFWISNIDNNIYVIGNWRDQDNKHYYINDDKNGHITKEYAKTEVKKVIKLNNIKEAKEASDNKKYLWDYYNNLTSCLNNKYLEKKKCVTHEFLRQDNKGNLVVPMIGIDDNYIDQIKSLQIIYGDGTKKFLKGFSTKDTFLYINTKADHYKNYSVFAFCEGISTTLSTYKFMRDVGVNNFCVINCFSAGNMPNIVKFFRLKFPYARLDVCIDVDNAGIKAGIKCKELVPNCNIDYPQFTVEQLKNNMTDFNDYYNRNFDYQKEKSSILRINNSKSYCDVDITFLNSLIDIIAKIKMEKSK